jgi:hypothetical protein
MNARLRLTRAISKLTGISVDRRVGSLLPAGLVASAVTVAVRGNAPYALRVIWALIAMAVNQFSRLDGKIDDVRRGGGGNGSCDSEHRLAVNGSIRRELDSGPR